VSLYYQKKENQKKRNIKSRKIDKRKRKMLVSIYIITSNISFSTPKKQSNSLLMNLSSKIANNSKVDQQQA